MPRDAGFSLVEVMVAMFVAALAAAAVIVAIPPSAPEAEQAAHKLAAALTRAQHAAVIEGAPLGLIVAAHHYRFAVWDEGSWRELDRTSGLGPQEWPDGLLVSAVTEMASDGAQDGVPALTFDETGGATPFSIHISGEDGAAIVRGDAAGGVVVEMSGA